MKSKIKKYILFPIGDYFAKSIILSWGKILSRKPRKQTTITREQLTEHLMNWKNSEKPERLISIGGTNFTDYLCDKLNLM